MKRAKGRLRDLLSVIALSASLTVFSGTASAATDYDNLLHVTPTLYVYTDGSAKTQKMDISATWWAEFKQTYAKRVAQNIGWPTNFVSEFESIRSSGGSWGVYTQETSQGILVSIVGTRDPNAYCGFVGSASSGSYQCASNYGYGFVRADYFTHNSYGGNGCIGSYGDRCSDTGMNVYDSPTIFTGTAGYTFVSMANFTLASYKFYFMNFDLNYPSGYEGEQIPTAAKFVALGDSFSSGEGNAPFDTGTDDNGVNKCHRSVSAYSRWLTQTPSLALGYSNFAACSGATTNDVLGIAEDDDPVGKESGGKQVDSLSDRTEFVTITIGGNDIGFSNFATACAAPGSQCGPSTAIYGTTMHNIHNVLPKKLEDVFTEIARRTSVARVYVIGYPYVTPSTGLDSLPVECSYLSSSAGDGADSLAARSVVAELNSTIRTAVGSFVNTLSDTSFRYIDPNLSIDGSFDDHDLCQGLESYFHNVAPNDVFGNGYRQKIFHPNVNGQYEYYKIVRGVMEEELSS